MAKRNNTAFRLDEVGKKGKLLWFKLSKLVRSVVRDQNPENKKVKTTSTTLVFASSLGLTGQWTLISENDAVPKYPRLKLIFADHPKTGPTHTLYYCDKLSMGKFVISDQSWLETKLKTLGQDIYGLAEKEFMDAYSNCNVEVYMALVKQSKISGIGNYLRSEIIEEARRNIEFDPFVQIKYLTNPQMKALYEAIVKVSNDVLNNSGVSEASETSYRDTSSKPGHYELKIYNKSEVIRPGGEKLPVKVFVDAEKRKFYYT